MECIVLDQTCFNSRHNVNSPYSVVNGGNSVRSMVIRDSSHVIVSYKSFNDGLLLFIVPTQEMFLLFP